MKLVVALCLLGLVAFVSAQTTYDEPYVDASGCAFNEFGLTDLANDCQCLRDFADGSTSTSGTDPDPLSIASIDLTNNELTIVFDEDDRYFYRNDNNAGTDTPDFRFYGPEGSTPTNAQQNCYDKFTWTVAEPAQRVNPTTDCSTAQKRRWTGKANLNQILSIIDDNGVEIADTTSGCYFELTRDEFQTGSAGKDLLKFNFAVRNMDLVPLTGSADTGLNYNDPTSWRDRLIEHIMPFTLEFTRQQDAAVSQLTATSIIDFGRAVISQATVRSGANPLQATMTIQMIIDMTNPYFIYDVEGSTVIAQTATASSERTIGGWKLAPGETQCDSNDLDQENPADNSCLKVYEFTVTQEGSLCDFANTFTSTFRVDCISPFNCAYTEDGGANPRPEIEIEFSVGSTNWCPVQGPIVEFDTQMFSKGVAPATSGDGFSPFGSVKTSFLQGQEMYFHVQVSNNDVPMRSLRFNSATITKGSEVSYTLISSGTPATGVTVGESAYARNDGVFGSTVLVSYFMIQANGDCEGWDQSTYPLVPDNDPSCVSELPFPLAITNEASQAVTVSTSLSVTYDLDFTPASFGLPAHSNSLFQPTHLAARMRTVQSTQRFTPHSVRSEEVTASASAAISGSGNTQEVSNEPSLVANASVLSGAFALVAVTALAVAIVATIKRKSIEKRIGDEIERSSSSNNMMLGELSSTNSDSN